MVDSFFFNKFQKNTIKYYSNASYYIETKGNSISFIDFVILIVRIL